MAYFTLNVNGKGVVGINPDQRLIDFLREDLGLTGVKEGCSGSGLCGACSIIIDGQIKKACKMTVGQAAEKSLITIEGLGTVENPHPIQKAFVLAGAIQCGFCTPGMILASKVLLDRYPDPTPKQIIKGLRPQLCRCTGYTKIIEAVKLAPKMLRGETCPSHAGQIVRPDALAKATGRDVYGADLKFPDMVHVVALRSPHPHAEIVDIDISQALSQPGVLDVITASDIPGINRYLRFAEDQPILAEKVVRFYGEPVAAVCATSRQLAEQAVDFVKVMYKPLTAVLDPFDALKPDAPQIHPQGNLLCKEQNVKGEVALGFQGSTVIVEGEFRTPWQEHAYMGPEAGLAFWDEKTERIVIIGEAQSPYETAKQVARVLGIDSKMVEIEQAASSGGFGGKIDLSYHCLVALFAQRLKRPVKMVLTREESFAASTKRHPFYMKCRIGADQQGKLQAVEMEIISDTGAYASQGSSVAKRATILATGPYNVPNVSINTRFVHTNNPVAGAMRGYGLGQVNFALESLMDELAIKLAINPLQLRLNNAYHPGDISVLGQELGSDIGFVETLLPLKDKMVNTLAANDGSDSSIRTGRGIASFWAGVGRTKAANAAKAEIILTEQGDFCLKSSAVEIGQNLNLTLMLLVSEVLGNQPLDRIKTILGNSITTPDAGSTSGSRQTFTSGNAIFLAAQELKAKIIARAAKILAEDENNLILVADAVQNIKSGAALSIDQLAREGALVGFGDYLSRPTLADGVTPTSYEIYAFGTQYAEVDVNVETGQVAVKKMIAVFDSGRIVDYLGAVGQVHGGIAMGLGFTLKENFNPMKTKNFNTYHLPRIDDVPEIEVVFTTGPKLREPLGVKGLGEFALLPTPAAICNAIYDACGKRVYELPVRLI